MTIHTGCQEEITTIHVDWFNENNVRQSTELMIRIQEQDKPRTLEIVVDGLKVAIIKGLDHHA
jgi:hypothetical protein